MTLAKYIKELQKLAKKHPEALKFQVVTSKDDEGNGYNPVFYTPTIGLYDEDEKEFRTRKSLEGYEDEEFFENFKENAVCVN